MRLDELASAFGLDPREAADHLWHLGIVADPHTDLAGDMLRTAREQLASIAAARRAPGPVLDSRTPAASTAPETASEAPEATKRLNIQPPKGAHRIYEVAQACGMPTSAVVEAAVRIGLKVDHVSQLSEAQIAAVWVALAETPPEGLVEKRVGRGIKRRRRVKTN